MSNTFQDQKKDQEKELNLLDLFIFLLKYKLLISSFVILTGVVVSLYFYFSATTTPPTKILPRVYYYSECAISPHNVLEDKVVESVSSRIEKLKMILMSRDLAILMSKENRVPIIRQNLWDDRSNKWVTDRIYSWDEQSGNVILHQPNSMVLSEEPATLYVKPQSYTLIVGFSSDDRDKTIRLLNKYLTYISDYYRKRDIETIKAKQALYQKQLLNVNDIYLKSRLAEKIIELTDSELRTKKDLYYGYDMIDSPSVMEEKSPQQSSRGPSMKRYIMMTLLLMMAAFVVALSLAGAMEYLTLAKKSDPAKFSALLKQLGLNNRGKKQV